MNILLVSAMSTESESIISYLKLKEQPSLAQFYPFYSSNINNHLVSLVQTHVGMINASTAVTLALQSEKFDYAIKIGCIGGNSSELKSNDIIVPTLFFNSGAWITRSLVDDKPTDNASIWESLYGDKPYQNNKGNLGGLDYFYYPNELLVNKYKDVLDQKGIKYFETPLGSGDIVIFSHGMSENIRSNILNLKDPHSSWCTDNESYAVAQVCKVNNLPFVGVYFVASSDYSDINGYDPQRIKSQTEITILPIVSELIKRL